MPEKPLKYPSGISNFKRIIEDGFLYVDKTDMVYELGNNETFVFLSRPRRFGKSLLTSTFESYFKGEKELFKNLKIMDKETKWEAYPVFRFDLSGESFDNQEKLLVHISNYLKIWEAEYGLQPLDSISQRFSLLIRHAFNVTGKKVVILIDEYDKPLLDSLQADEIHAQIRNELRAFYSVIKASEQYVRFAFLTGVTKFSKVTIFSGLNNLQDISLTPSYNSLCGISESEVHEYFQSSVEKFAQTNGMVAEDVWKELKDSYDGYHFARTGEDIYNPISVIKTFKEGEFRDYWFDTGRPDFIFKLIERYNFEVGKLENTCRRAEQLGDIANLSTDIVPLLYQAGYLTIKNYDIKTRLYKLGFPNREVSSNFWDSLAKYFFPNQISEGVFNLSNFVRDIENGKPEDFMVRLKSLFADTPSSPENNKEVHFQNMFAIVTKMLGNNIELEKHFSQGRCDMILSTHNYIYIFEFKIDRSAEAALLQIHEKGYYNSYLIDKRQKFLIGANFSTKTRTLSDWVIEEV